MNFDAVEQIANAVLYEGYMLYPYRPSSTKNQQRWNFGTLYPQIFAERLRPTEAFSLQAECLVEAMPAAKLTVRARFLHLDSKAAKDDGWIEAVERSAEAAYAVGDLLAKPHIAVLLLGPLTGKMTVEAKSIDREMVKLEYALAQLHTPLKVAITHYAPIKGTVIGEPEPLFPFLGSSRLERPLSRHKPVLALHGHAHKGSFTATTQDGIKVCNVALHILHKRGEEHPFVIFNL